MIKIKRTERIVVKKIGRLLDVDSCGRIWRIGQYKPRIQRDSKNRFLPGRITSRTYIRYAKPKRAEHKTKNGYLRIFIQEKKKRFCVYAHRLVWQYFFGDIPEGFETNHRNGDKTDNRPENLEIVTRSTNTKHAYAFGLMDTKGEKHPSNRLSEIDVRQIRQLYANGVCTQKQLANRFNVTRPHIGNIISHRAWKHITENNC